MAFAQQCPSCPSLSHLFGPSCSSSGPCPLVPGTARSSLRPLPSPPVSYGAARSPGPRCCQLTCWPGQSPGRMTIPSFSFRHQRQTPSSLGTPTWSPGLVEWNAHTLRSVSSAPPSVGLMPLSLGCMMATSCSHDRPSSSTFAWLSLDSGWTHPNMQDTLFVKEQPLGWHHRAPTRTPSSFSADGTQTAIADMLTVQQLSGAQWLLPPSI